MVEILDRQHAPARHRLDVGAYYKMAEAGILTQDDRVELIGGEIFDMTPIGSAHAGKTNRLNRLFARAAVDGLPSSACRARCGSTLTMSPSLT